MKPGLIAAIGLLLAATVHVPLLDAQEQGQGQGEPNRGRSSRGITYTYEDDIIVRGKIAKPQVAFLISREKANTEEALVLRERFVPKILEAVKEPPF